VQMLETALLTGPFDWNPALMPRSEFDARINTIRVTLRRHGLDGLVVGGTSPEHGALCYLTSFVPKLGPALAFIPLEGDLRIAFSGGPAMLPSAQRLTFVTDVRAMRDPEREFADWLHDSGGEKFGLWGEYAITADVREGLGRAAPKPLAVLDSEFDPLRRRKSDAEIHLIRRACAILGEAHGAFRAAIKAGKGVRTAALAAERLAYREGAQDMRVLASLRDAGTPEPLQADQDPHVDPLLVCLAVRYAGYWAEGLMTVTAKPNAALDEAEAALSALLGAVRPGLLPLDTLRTAFKAAPDRWLHPCVNSGWGNGIGLSRDEIPFPRIDTPQPLQEGDICTLRAGFAAHEPAGNAIVSAIVRIGPDGAQVLWR
jgi:Xaa-Pro aminopeptidase